MRLIDSRSLCRSKYLFMIDQTNRQCHHQNQGHVKYHCLCHHFWSIESEWTPITYIYRNFIYYVKQAAFVTLLSHKVARKNGSTLHMYVKYLCHKTFQGASSKFKEKEITQAVA